MKFSLTSHHINIILLVLLLLFGLGSFAYNQYLLDHILQKERSNVRLWAKAVEFAGNPAGPSDQDSLNSAIRRLEAIPSVPDSLMAVIRSSRSRPSPQNFVVQQIILKDQLKIPAIITSRKGKVLYGKHINGKLNHKQVRKLAAYHTPIKLRFGEEGNQRTQYVYYGESATVRYLRYFPFIQIGLLALVLGMAYVSYRTISRSEQSNIWVGMTREAAHQLGTPLSSMYGWIGLLREERPDDPFAEKVASELENDVERLQGIADRFNKIGSEPELEPTPLAPHIAVVVDYMKRRLPHLGKKVEIQVSVDSQIRAMINPELFEWALENIIKNAMNAIKIKKRGAFVSVKVQQVEDEVQIDVEDSGQGIDKKYHKEIFKPGFSTKKRGWGLGLSLTKRIIEEYHNGKIFVLESEVGSGTTIRIVLRAGLKQEKEKN